MLFARFGKFCVGESRAPTVAGAAVGRLSFFGFRGSRFPDMRFLPMIDPFGEMRMGHDPMIICPDPSIDAGSGILTVFGGDSQIAIRIYDMSFNNGRYQDIWYVKQTAYRN